MTAPRRVTRAHRVLVTIDFRNPATGAQTKIRETGTGDTIDKAHADAMKKAGQAWAIYRTAWTRKASPLLEWLRSPGPSLPGLPSHLDKATQFSAIATFAAAILPPGELREKVQGLALQAFSFKMTETLRRHGLIPHAPGDVTSAELSARDAAVKRSIFRAGTAADWPGLDALQRECYPASLWSSGESLPTLSILVAELDGKIIAAAMGRVFQLDGEGFSAFHLHSVEVSPDYRRSRLALNLSRALLAQAGYPTITAYAVSEAGFRLSRALGLRWRDNETIDIDGHPARVMRADDVCYTSGIIGDRCATCEHTITRRDHPNADYPPEPPPEAGAPR